MFSSPIVSSGSRPSNVDKKRRLFEGLEREEIECTEENKTIKKTKMTEPATKDDLQEMVKQITAIQLIQIKNSEKNMSDKIDCMQTDLNTIKSKQDAQDRDVQKISDNQDKLFQFHSDVIKRLDDLEKGENSTKTNIKTNLTSYQEKLREQVAKTFMKVAIFDLPDGKTTAFIREQAEKMDLPQHVKDEMQNNAIEFIADKRGPNAEKKGKLHHMITSGLQARQAIIYAAKNRPGNMRWDIVIPKDMKAGHNAQRALVWQLRMGLKLSVQQEIHGHTIYVFINEKESTSNRRTFSEFTPVEKDNKGRRLNEMETNIDTNIDDRPTIFYNDNKTVAEELASMIFWTGVVSPKDEDNINKMKDLAEFMSEEDFKFIITDKTVHSKYHSKLAFKSREDATFIYNKYAKHAHKPENWKWTTFRLDDFNVV